MEILFFNEQIQIIFELVDFIVAIFVIILAVGLVKLTRGGALAIIWSWMIVGVIFFVFMQLFGLLTTLGVANMDFFMHLCELLVIVSFAIAFYKGRKLLS